MNFFFASRRVEATKRANYWISWSPNKDSFAGLPVSKGARTCTDYMRTVKVNLQLENSRGHECSSIGKLLSFSWHSASMVNLQEQSFRSFL